MQPVPTSPWTWTPCSFNVWSPVFCLLLLLFVCYNTKAVVKALTVTIFLSTNFSDVILNNTWFTTANNRLKLNKYWASFALRHVCQQRDTILNFSPGSMSLPLCRRQFVQIRIFTVYNYRCNCKQTLLKIGMKAPNCDLFFYILAYSCFCIALPVLLCSFPVCNPT